MSEHHAGGSKLRLAVFAVIGVVIVVLLFAATRPGTFLVQRSTSIKAPPERVYALVSDFKNWAAWSPYEKLDPAMKRTYSGAASGTGAVYQWDGDTTVGAGRMMIARTTAPSLVSIKLDFTRPLEAHNTADFTLRPDGDQTNVTWAMYGPSPYLAKLMGIFFSMDSLLGKDFEAGLANLKIAAEKGSL